MKAHWVPLMNDAGARIAASFAAVVRSYERGVLTPDEAGKQILSILWRSPGDAALDDSWELRVVLAALMKPNGDYRTIAHFVPSAIGPVDFEVDVGPGWSVGPAPSPLSSSLAVVQLVPPESDLLVGLASIYRSQQGDNPPLGHVSPLGGCNEIDFQPSSNADADLGSSSSPRSAVSVEPGPDGILVMAHTIPQVRAAVSHFTAYGLQQQPALDEPAAFAILQNTLRSVRQVLVLRRGWRGKHPSWGVMPPGLLPVLRCAPTHIPEARAWRADSLRGGDGIDAVKVVCAEIDRLESTPLAGDESNRVELHRDGTRVIDIIEQWSETLRCNSGPDDAVSAHH